MAERTVEDRLREEYSALLPHARRITEQLETEIRYRLLPLYSRLGRHERLVVRARVKDCESAIDKLRGEGAVFDADQSSLYTLKNLNDMAGVRVMAFPKRLRREIDHTLREQFPEWEPDSFGNPAGPLAFKYSGYLRREDSVKAEYQVVSMLTGLFWEVEHGALYKPEPELRGIAGLPAMDHRYKVVIDALSAFEEEFERLTTASE